MLTNNMHKQKLCLLLKLSSQNVYILFLGRKIQPGVMYNIYTKFTSYNLYVYVLYMRVNAPVDNGTSRENRKITPHAS